MPEDSAAGSVRVLDFTEMSSCDSRNAVVLCQGFVQVRVVRRIQLQRTAILTNQTIEEQFGLSEHRIGKLLVKIRKEQSVRVDFVQVLQTEPLTREPCP